MLQTHTSTSVVADGNMGIYISRSWTERLKESLERLEVFHLDTTHSTQRSLAVWLLIVLLLSVTVSAGVDFGSLHCSALSTSLKMGARPQTWRNQKLNNYFWVRICKWRLLNLLMFFFIIFFFYILFIFHLCKHIEATSFSYSIQV